MKRRILITTLLALSLLSPACAPKATTPGQKPAITADDVLRAAKVFSSTLAIALNQGIALERTLAADGTIDIAIEPKLRQGLADALVAVNAFNARAANYTTLDATSKADIAKLLDDSIAFIADLNANGLLRIKSEKSKQIAGAIIAGAQIAVVIFQAVYTRLQP